MLRTITENRTASIIFEDRSVSKQFQLQTGAPQGNSPSPVQYNIGEQILILKLELDPAIARVYNHSIPPRFVLQLAPEPPGPDGPDPAAPVPDPAYPGHMALDYNIRGEQRFLSESNKQTGNTEAFADDSTIFTLADRRSLLALKKYPSFLCQF